ncbi:hypothetical protein H0H81_005811 [Sphagnurus paluster]|uniref:Uncharacterized protein n=1 Tax=Sphagnurus paluster TaxID=117069 RepID=A0A9P7FLA6_9AGAR|nr:hypothetical protein H0H81_005811 [Sphagnurus paluster]
MPKSKPKEKVWCSICEKMESQSTELCHRQGGGTPQVKAQKKTNLFAFLSRIFSQSPSPPAPNPAPPSPNLATVTEIAAMEAPASMSPEPDPLALLTDAMDNLHILNAWQQQDTVAGVQTQAWTN